MMENPLSSHTPLNRCPPNLVPTMLEVLAAHNAATPSAAEGIHEKTVEMAGDLYDQLIVLYYQAFGTPLSCDDPKTGTRHTVSFIDQPSVVHQTISDHVRQYTVHVKLMKLPTFT